MRFWKQPRWYLQNNFEIILQEDTNTVPSNNCVRISFLEIFARFPSRFRLSLFFTSSVIPLSVSPFHFSSLGLAISFFLSRFCHFILPLSISLLHSSSWSCLGHFAIPRGLAISSASTTTKKVCFRTRHHHHHSGLSFFLPHSSTPNFLLLIFSIALHKPIVNIAKHEPIL